MDKFGIEIEFGVDIEKYYDFFRNFNKPKWHVYCEGSVDEGNIRGLEFVSPIFSSINEISTDLKELLKMIKDHGVITRNCGLHFHFSNGVINRKTLRDFIGNYVNIWENRNFYSNGFSRFEYDKFQSVRKVEPGHYELRMFNGTRSYDKICKNFNLLKRGIKIALNE